MTLYEAVDSALAKLAELERTPYDGVLGQLPEWMPHPLVLEFQSLQRELLLENCTLCDGASHSPNEVRLWLDAYREAMKPVDGYRQIPFFPIEHAYALRDLAYIQDISNLGSHRGLAAYLGTGAQTVLRSNAQSVIAQQKRPDGLQNVISHLLQSKSDSQPALPYIVRRLKELEGDSIVGVRIESVTDDEIEWSSEHEPAKSTPRSGLKNRVSRAGQQITAIVSQSPDPASNSAAPPGAKP